MNNQKIINLFLKEFPENYAHRGYVITILVKLVTFLEDKNFVICKKNQKE